ncbi:hypothetical protein EKK58_03790 [Candidatus Dependentiae bacterium]|nr:MAG: hypothetical protein EKK58_03790 [Candidatus Dependentiae bacterium]
MKNIQKLILILIIFCEAKMVLTRDLKDQISTATHKAKKETHALSKAVEKKIKQLKKKLEKAKYRYEKKLRRLIAKNVPQAECEKSKDLIILKKEIEKIQNELNSLR